MGPRGGGSWELLPGVGWVLWHKEPGSLRLSEVDWEVHWIGKEPSLNGDSRATAHLPSKVPFGLGLPLGGRLFLRPRETHLGRRGPGGQTVSNWAKRAWQLQPWGSG